MVIRGGRARRRRNGICDRLPDRIRECIPTWLAESGSGGFSLIEIMMAVLVLTVGLLGLAGTTGFILRQTTLSDVTTERAWAQQSVIERLRAMPLSDVSSGSRTSGYFTMAWTLTEDTNMAKTVRLITTGPGLGRIGGFPTLAPSVADTITFQLIDLNP